MEHGGPHPIFVARRHELALDALRDQLNTERKRRIAAERRAVLRAAEWHELTKVRELKKRLGVWRFLFFYTLLMFVLAILMLKGWI